MWQICRQLLWNFKMYFFPQTVFPCRSFRGYIICFLHTGSHSFISLISGLTPCTSPPTLVARSHFLQYSHYWMKKWVIANALPDVLPSYYHFYFIWKEKTSATEGLLVEAVKPLGLKDMDLRGFFWLGMCLSRSFLVLAFANQGLLQTQLTLTS